MLNWLPNVEFNKESRFFTTKDVSENAEKIQTADKALRDLKRKRAVEKATAESIDSKGDFKEDLARESLKRSGFGEEADTLVNEITTKKTAKSKENLDFRKNLLEAVALGTVKQDVAEKLFGGPLQDTVQTQAPASVSESVVKPVVSPDVRNGGMPLSPAAQALINGSKPQVGPQQAPTAVQSAPATTTSQASSQSPSQPSQSNFFPRYSQMGPMDFSQFNGEGSKVNPVTFALSDDPLLASYQKKAAAGSLGGLDSEKASNENIASRIQQIAENKFPKKSPAQFMTDGKIDMGKFLDYDRSRQSNIEGHKQELAKAVLTQANQMRSTDLDARKTANSEKQTNITIDEKYIPGYQKAIQGTQFDDYKARKAATEAIFTSLQDLKNTQINTPGYDAAVKTFATNIAQAEGTPGAAGVWEEIVHTSMTGGDLNTITKANPTWQSKLNSLAQYGLDWKQRGALNPERLAIAATKKARSFGNDLIPQSYEQLFGDFPVVGETALDQEAYKKKHKLGESVGGVNRPPEKPKTAKEAKDKAVDTKKKNSKFNVPSELK